MSQITQYISGSVTDTKIQLGEDQIVRTLSITGSWNVLRIGSRLSVSSSVSHSLLAPTTPLKFFYGLSSGVSQSMADSQSLNVFGVSYLKQNAMYTDCLDSGSQVSGSGQRLKVFVKNYGNTGSYNYSTFQGYLSIGKYPVRSMFILEITKGTPDYFVRVLSPMISSSVVDASLTDLTSAMTLPVMSASNYTLQGTATASYSEASGSLDSVNIYWGSAFKPLEISEVIWVKMS